LLVVPLPHAMHSPASGFEYLPTLQFSQMLLPF
jgi:hypothetical protein